MKHLLIFVLIFTFTTTSSAQDSVDGFMKLFDWVKKLDDNISSIVRTENQKKLVRQLGYVQSDLDDLIKEKEEMTKDLRDYCIKDASVSISEIEKKLDSYNKEIKALTKRLEDIRKAIIFEDDLYSVTERKKVIVYRKPPPDEISSDTNPQNMMVQSAVRQSRADGKVPKDTIMDVIVQKNKNEWKEVDIEGLLFEIKTSLDTKSSNMEYIVQQLSKDCDVDLINDESNMAITVLTNIRNEFGQLRKKVKDYKPQ